MNRERDFQFESTEQIILKAIRDARGIVNKALPSETERALQNEAFPIILSYLLAVP